MSYPVVAPVDERQRRPLALFQVVSMVMVLAIVFALAALGDPRLMASVVAVGAGLSGAVLYAALSEGEALAD
mgnify:CR=1 FL=1